MRYLFKKFFITYALGDWLKLTFHVLGIGLLTWFYIGHTQPQIEWVSQLYFFFKNFGPGLFFIVPVIYIIKGYEVKSIIGPTITGVYYYVMIVFLIGEAGDDIYTAYRNNPSDAVLTFLALWFVWIVGRSMIPVSGKYTEKLSQSGSVRYLSSELNAVTTKRDRRYIAAHETGHLMMYAGIDTLPDGLEIVVKDYIDGESLGYVSGVVETHTLTDIPFANFRMITWLAGKRAETFKLGENTIGSADDHDKWMQGAKAYLACHHNGIFYSNTNSKYEVEHNNEMLEELKAAQLELIDQIFENNSSIFDQINNDLLLKGTLKKKDVEPYLNKIVLPEKFPAPIHAADYFKVKGIFTSHG